MSNIRAVFGPGAHEQTFAAQPASFTAPLSLDRFLPTTAGEERALIISSPNKSCQPHALPSHVMKRHAELLAPSIARLVNLSLASGVFSSFKCALVTPLIKKAITHHSFFSQDLFNCHEKSNETH